VKQKKHTDNDPLLDIIKNFTFTFYRKVCQSIFEKDKLLFTFLLAFRILEGDNCLDERLFDFFLKGFQIQPDTGVDDDIDNIKSPKNEDQDSDSSNANNQ
jgi:hypothetical protein